jgi:hypothetical protein
MLRILNHRRKFDAHFNVLALIIRHHQLILTIPLEISSTITVAGSILPNRLFIMLSCPLRMAGTIDSIS